jgi:hypothetical protein
MNGKKGFLLGEETVKIIVAVIAIGFLVYLLVYLYYNSKKNEKLEQAEASLEHIISEAGAGVSEVQIYNPSDFYPNYWKIVSFSKREIPKACSNLGWSSCLCICNNEFIDGDADECDEQGTCRESTLLVEGQKISIRDVPLTLEIKDGIIRKNELG